jgi:hypothetical protein
MFFQRSDSSGEVANDVIQSALTFLEVGQGFLQLLQRLTILGAPRCPGAQESEPPSGGPTQEHLV